MKFNKIYIALGMVLALTSCKSDEPMPVEKTEPYMSFTISLSEEGTRAGDNDRDPFGHDWDEDGDEDGTAFDRKVNSIVAVLYSVPDGKKIVESAPVGEIKVVDKKDNGNGTWTFTGTMKSDFTATQLQGGNYRLAVYVNSDNIDIRRPATHTFSHHGIAGDESEENVNFNGIPMYGVGDVKFTGLIPSQAYDADHAFSLLGAGGDKLSIPVLRSMAKIRITVDKKNEFKADGTKNPDWLGAETGRKVKLVSFSISKHNTQGYVVPKGWNTQASVRFLSTSTAFNPVVNSANNQDWLELNCTHTPGKSQTGNSEKMLRFYLPETINDQENPIKLKVKYFIDGKEKEGDEMEHTFCISLKGEEEATQWDIFRNTVYEFDIVGVEENFGLDLQVSVKDWNYHRVPAEL
ncbi:MAG: hypothetical protein K2M39_07625 [Muribaculaceae bacterium]|nr:hypothetical protein [Muribaculaceae bacterium]